MASTPFYFLYFIPFQLPNNIGKITFYIANIILISYTKKGVIPWAE